MNCKPGDLAVTLHSSPDQKGRFVTVVKAYSGSFGRSSARWWVCTTPSPFRTEERVEKSGALVLIHDDYLRPIRDPGDDAQDETLQWLPVPQRETVAA